MNRKNTILTGVAINACLLGVLLVTALTVQEESVIEKTPIAEAPLELPRFSEPTLFATLPQVIHTEEIKLPELVMVEPPPAPAPVVVLPPPPAPAIALAPIAAPSEVIVKKGETLDKIAKMHHTTVDEILKLNQLPSSFLKIGQVLKLPTPKTSEKKAIETGPEYYTMKVGDNPWAVALKHHIKVDELLRLNGLNEERARKLKPGDRLRTR